jgi:hypothetical protein
MTGRSPDRFYRIRHLHRPRRHGLQQRMPIAPARRLHDRAGAIDGLPGAVVQLMGEFEISGRRARNTDESVWKTSPSFKAADLLHRDLGSASRVISRSGFPRTHVSRCGR